MAQPRLLLSRSSPARLFPTQDSDTGQQPNMLKKINDPLDLLPVVLGIWLAFTVLISLAWRYQHDTAIMLYIAFAMDRFSLVPYRDILDINFPGTHYAYYLIGKLFGYSDRGIRAADLLTLTAILGVNWMWMKRISARAAWCGSG